MQPAPTFSNHMGKPTSIPMKKLLFTFLSLLGLTYSLSAQDLLEPLNEVPVSNRGYALLKSGEVIEGRIRTTNSSRGITKVKLEDEFGDSHTISSEDMYEFAIAMNEGVRLQYAMEAGSSVQKLLSKKESDAQPADFIIFRNTSIDGKKELLLQLLNPELDEVFEVFYDPYARKTTELSGTHVNWSGDRHRAYFVSKNGGPLLKVKKGNYRKMFSVLFGDCPQMSQLIQPTLDDLERHIASYTSSCPS
jgi:hypothetical protein